MNITEEKLTEEEEKQYQALISLLKQNITINRAMFEQILRISFISGLKLGMDNPHFSYKEQLTAMQEAIDEANRYIS